MENISESNFQIKENEIEKESKKQNFNNYLTDDQQMIENKEIPNYFKEQSSKQQQQKESKTVSQKTSTSSSVSDYIVTVTKYKYFEEFLKNIDDVTLKNKIQNISFKVVLTDSQFKKIDPNKYQNDQIKLEKTTKDQHLCYEFPPENVPYIKHIIADLKKFENTVEFYSLDNQIIIKNRNRDDLQFRQVQEIINQQMKVQLMKVPIAEIFQQQPDIYNNRQCQSTFYKSKFLNDILLNYGISCIMLLLGESRPLCFDITSTNQSRESTESETEHEPENQDALFNEKSVLLLYGFDEENLQEAKRQLILYSSQPIILDFSVDTKNKQTNKKEKVDDEIANAKKELFIEEMKKAFENQIKENGIDSKEEGKQQSCIRYRLSGDRNKISQIERQWADQIQQILHKVYNKQEFDDNFFQNIVQKQLKELEESIQQQKLGYLMKVLESSIIFVYINNQDNQEKQKKIKSIKEKIEFITNLKKIRLQNEISLQLNPKLEEFKESIMDDNQCCQISTKMAAIYLTGTQSQISKTKEKIEEFIGQNILQEYTEIVDDPLIKSIIIKYAQEEIKNVFPAFEIDENKNRGNSYSLKYKIPLFFRRELDHYLKEKIQQIRTQITEIPYSCTKHQFEILQKNDLPFFKKIQEELAIELIADVKKLNDLGHKQQYIQVNPSDYDKCFVYASNSPSLQVIMINGNIENINLDSLMLNITIDGHYIDAYSSDIVSKTGCCRYAIDDINKLQSSQASKINLETVKNTKDNKSKSKRNFQYLQSSLLNTNFPTQKIFMAILKKDFVNIKELLEAFFEDNKDQLDIGIIIPNKEDEQKEYIKCLREILFQQFPDDDESTNLNPKSKNIYIFCEKAQLNILSFQLMQENPNQILLFGKNSKKQIFMKNAKQYYLDVDKPIPVEFTQLLNEFYNGTHRNKQRFNAFLPKEGLEVYHKRRIVLQGEPKILIQNTSYFLDTYLENQTDEEIKEQILEAVQNASEQRLENLYIYEDDYGVIQSDYVKVYVNKRKVRYAKNKDKTIDIKERDIDQDSKKDFIYVIRGYEQSDINKAQEKLNNEIFRNQDRILWDYSYVDENHPNIIDILPNSKDVQIKQIYEKYREIFKQAKCELITLQFIQNNPLAQKFQDQLTILHKKCEGTPQIYEDMFYMNRDIKNLAEIFECREIGFDVRVHNQKRSQLNKYSIQLQSKPRIEQVNSNQDECLICEVIGGNSYTYKDNMLKNKRLGRDLNNQFYDSWMTEQDSEDFIIGIFDNFRIYPTYYATYKKYEMVDTTDCSFNK